MLRNIDFVLRNLYLRKYVGYFHYVLEYVLKRFNHQLQVKWNNLILLFEFILKCFMTDIHIVSKSS